MESLPFIDGLINLQLMSLGNGDILVHRNDGFFMFSYITKQWQRISSYCGQISRWRFFPMFGFVRRDKLNVEFWGFEKGIKTLSIYQLWNFGIVYRNSIYIPILQTDEVRHIHYFDEKFHILCQDRHIIVEATYQNPNSSLPNENIHSFSYKIAKYDVCYPCQIYLDDEYCSSGSDCGKSLILLSAGMSNKLYEYKEKWKQLDCKIPIILIKPIIVSTTNGQFCIIFGGRICNTSSFSKQIFILNTITKVVTTSSVQLKSVSKYMTGVLVSSAITDKLLTFGFARHFNFPDYIMEFMSRWVIMDYIHIIDTLHRTHYRIQVDHILP